MRKLWLVVMVCGGLLLVQERSAGAEQGRSLGVLTSGKAAKKELKGVKKTIKIMEDKLERAKRTAETLDRRHSGLRSPYARALLMKLKGLYEQYIPALSEDLELRRQGKHHVTWGIGAKSRSIYTILHQVEILLNLYNRKDSTKRLVKGHADNEVLVSAAEKMVGFIDRLIIVETQILKLTEYKVPIAAELSEASWDFRMNSMEAMKARRQPPPVRSPADSDEAIRRKREALRRMRAIRRERNP